MAVVALEPQAPPVTLPRTMMMRHSSNGPQTVAAPPGRLASRVWYDRARDARTAVWTEPHDEPSTARRRVCAYAVPVIVNGEFRGVCAVSIYVEELQVLRNRPDRAAMRESNPQTQPASVLDIAPATLGAGNEFFAVLDAQGHIISAPNSRPIDTRSLFDAPPSNADFTAAAQNALIGQSTVVRVDALHTLIPGVDSDAHHWVAFTEIPATGWIFAAAIPESAVVDPILRRLWQRAAFLGAGLAILLAVVLLVSIRISKPIERLAGAVDRLAAGDMDAQVTGVRGRDELARLADGFNHMTRELKAHVKALTEQTAAREKVESELRIARKIQTDLLPRTFPPFPGRNEFELHATNIPAAGVAGDFFDFFFASPDRLTIAVADVSGKGVPAAILMAVTRTIVRNLAEAGLSPAEIVRRANTMLIADTGASMFVTMFLCQYEPATGRIVYVNAGHPPPVRFSPTEPPRRFGAATAPLIGVDSGAEIGAFEQAEDRLGINETLVIYTDGLTEAHNSRGEMLREAGLTNMIQSSPQSSCAALCDALNRGVEAFEAGRRSDDLTLLVLRRLS
jgi:sigma-B regulation protein RsbU (phosphoserine phosphatase)